MYFALWLSFTSLLIVFHKFFLFLSRISWQAWIEVVSCLNQKKKQIFTKFWNNMRWWFLRNLSCSFISYCFLPEIWYDIWCDDEKITKNKTSFLFHITGRSQENFFVLQQLRTYPSQIIYCTHIRVISTLKYF